jgi:hypothetical protein
VLRPGAAPGYCVELLTPASLAGDCREPMSRAQHPPAWQGQWRYAVPSLAQGNTLFSRRCGTKNRIHMAAALYQGVHGKGRGL